MKLAVVLVSFLAVSLGGNAHAASSVSSSDEGPGFSYYEAEARCSNLGSEMFQCEIVLEVSDAKLSYTISAENMDSISSSISLQAVRKYSDCNWYESCTFYKLYGNNGQEIGAGHKITYSRNVYPILSVYSWEDSVGHHTIRAQKFWDASPEVEVVLRKPNGETLIFVSGPAA